MSDARVIVSVLIMAGVTYLIRMLPLVIFKRKIQSPFVRSFLMYIPYAVLSAMTFPAILFSAGRPLAGVVGLAAALILSYREKGLLTVALGATAVVFLTEQFLLLAGF